MKNFNKPELIEFVSMLVREKDITHDVVFEILENSILKAARSKYGNMNDFEVNVHRNSGAIDLFLIKEVVDSVVDFNKEISLEEANSRNMQYQIGDFVKTRILDFKFGRSSVQTARQEIIKQVKEAERVREYEAYKDKIGEVVSGSVKRIGVNNIVLSLNNAEAVIGKRGLIPGEKLKMGDRVRGVISSVNREISAIQIQISRYSDEFILALFKQEIPEVYDGNVEVIDIAREPGSRAKVIVKATEGIDPVAVCIGVRGNRIKTIISELKGEKIDVIKYTNEIPRLIVDILAVKEIKKIIYNAEDKTAIVIVNEEYLGYVIGRRGQNIRFVNKLTGVKLEVMTQEAYEDKQNVIKLNATNYLSEVLSLEEEIAEILFREGYRRVSDIINSDVSTLANIEEFDADIAEELFNRAVEWEEESKKQFDLNVKELNIQDDLIQSKLFPREDIIILANNKVKSLKDFAYLDIDELIEILGDTKIDAKKASEMIMDVRKNILFKDSE